MIFGFAIPIWLRRDEYDGLSQPRQILGHVPCHPAVRGAYPRRVGRAWMEVRVQAADDVEGGGAEEEEGGRGLDFILIA